MNASEAMMSSPAPRHGAVPPQASEEVTVETRFGPIACSPQALIEMPQGPLGFAEHRRFALLDLPNPRLAQFRLLQSMADPGVSFVVVPTGRDSSLIEQPDIDEACGAAGIPPADLLVLLIVTVRQTPDGSAMTVNLRAPVMLDVRRRTARQIVLPNPAYSVRHPL
jgi:flagellar assembly factor FliW